MFFFMVFIFSALFAALEITGIRILSFSTGGSAAYMLAAVGATGFAAAGTVLSIWKNKKNYENVFFVSSVLFTLSVPAVWTLAALLPVDPAMPNKLNFILFLAAAYLLLSIPSFLAGFSIIPLFEKSAGKANLLYSFLLLGFMSGALAVFPLMESAGAGGALSLITVCSAVSAALFSFSRKNKAKCFVSVLLLLVSLCVYPLKDKLFVFKPVPSKILGMTADGAGRAENTAWNRAGRVDIVENVPKSSFFDFFPEAARDMLTVDGESASFIYDFSANPAAFADSLYSAGYYGQKNPDVFAAGFSSADIGAALFWNARSVTSADANKAKIDLIVKKYSMFEKYNYRNVPITVVNDDIRSFLEKTSKKFDLIQFSGVDTQSVVLNGMSITNESYLYTSEALNIYMERLKENGTLAFIRWMFWPPRETLKLAAMSVSALKKAGIRNPENNIVVIGNGIFASTLVKKRSFTWTEINEINDLVLATPNMRIIYAPGFSAGEQYYAPIFTGINFSSEQGTGFIESGFDYFFDSVRQGREEEFIAEYPYNIRPAVDDIPFFFNYFKFGSERFSREIRSFTADSSYSEFVIFLLTALQLLFLTLSMLVSPVVFMHDEEKKFKPVVQIFSFAACGFGFMFILMNFMHNAALIFGNPAVSSVRAIAMMLAFAAAGSLFCKKILILLGEKTLFSALMLLLPLMILGYAALFPGFAAFCAGYGFTVKLIFTALFIAPLGFTAGLVFPLSLLLAGEKKSSFIPLALSANTLPLILTSVISIIIAMSYGFKFVFVLSAFCYFTAVAAMLYSVKTCRNNESI